jgi:hypothetical protein
MMNLKGTSRARHGTSTILRVADNPLGGIGGVSESAAYTTITSFHEVSDSAG